MLSGEHASIDTPLLGNQQTLFRFIEILVPNGKIVTRTKCGRLLHFISNNAAGSDRSMMTGGEEG